MYLLFVYLWGFMIGEGVGALAFSKSTTVEKEEHPKCRGALLLGGHLFHWESNILAVRKIYLYEAS